MLEHALEVWRSGGFVMPPLAAATLLLWWTLGRRIGTLRRGQRGSLRALMGAAEGGRLRPTGLVDAAVAVGVSIGRAHPEQVRARVEVHHALLREQLSAGARTVMVIVAVAPLAGLLGTVTGMIETFDSLASMTLFSRSGGIAGGVSQALVSTQAGLAVAIPGVLAGRVLATKQRRLELELEELQELLVAHFGHGEGS